jgi:hypothetical protein
MRHENAFSLFNPGNGQESRKTMSSDKVNRPFSALIWNLGPLPYIAREIVREPSYISRLFALRPKPRSCLDQPVSPIIIARQEILSGKRRGG